MKIPKLLLTDTHPLVWYMTAQNTKLPARVRRAFDDACEGKSAIFIPAVVIWELSMLIKSGVVKPQATLKEYVQERFYAKAISILEIETDDILLSHELTFTKDPFDSLIVAMALRVDSPLITADSAIHQRRPCEIFWN